MVAKTSNVLAPMDHDEIQRKTNRSYRDCYFIGGRIYYRQGALSGWRKRPWDMTIS